VSIDEGSKSSAPGLWSILGLVLAVVGLIAIGRVGWYWLGIALGASTLIRAGWVDIHRHDVRVPATRRGWRAVARLLSTPINAAATIVLVVSLSLLVMDRTGSPGPENIEQGGGASGIAVQPDQVSADLQLFTSALGDNFKILVFDLQDMSNGTEGPEYDAPILGSWWALADWCSTNRRGAVGSCYDQAASYYVYWFHRDPRAINTDTWVGVGAIAGIVSDAYQLTTERLGVTSAPTPYVQELMAGRPGVDILCTPSCAARIDR
jgi:hypothetical protein